jgi:uncharacterized membrane protein YgdD (TMEM256/DUF423 family)
MNRRFAVLGALSAFIAVGAGAFGAHGLEGTLASDALEVWEIAARYQMYHALGLLAAAVAAGEGDCPPARWAGRLFLLGTVLFSGSLYALAVTGNATLGMVTPLGGVAFLAGWLALAAAFARRA